MSITAAVLNVHFYLEKLTPPPYHFTSKNPTVQSSPFYNKSAYKIFRILLRLVIILFFFPSLLLRFIWLFYHWKVYTIDHLEEAIVYGFTLCVGLVYAPAASLLHEHGEMIIYIGNQMFKLTRNVIKSESSKYCVSIPILGKRSVKELFIYGFSMGFGILAPGYFAASFVLPYLPLQLMFGNSFVVKFFEASIFGLVIFYGAFTVLPVILVAMLYLENMIGYTKFLQIRNLLAQNVETKLSTKFWNCLKRFRNSQILLQLGSIIYAQFLTDLIFVGVLLASCGACVTIKMYGKIYVLTYLLFPSLTIISVIDAIILTHLADIPYKNSKLFKSQWISRLTRTEDKQRLKACKPTGFILGPYGLCTATLGLHICDEYIHNTVTIILLGVI